MKKPWRRIREEFETNPVATTYYFFVGTVAFVTVSLTVLRFLEQNSAAVPYIQTAIIVLVGGAFILAPPILYQAFWSHRRQQLLNPKVEILTSSYDVSIMKAGRAFVRQDKLVALDKIDRFAFQLRPTGSPTVAVRLQSPGKLHGPVQKRDKIRYEIEFPTRLNQGDTYDLRLEMEIDDPGGSMKPFFSLLGAGVAKYGQVNATIRFPQATPKSVCYESCAAGTEIPLAPIVDLLPNSQGEYRFKFHAVRPNELHVVSWLW